MQELIKVTTNANGSQVVSARELLNSTRINTDDGRFVEIVNLLLKERGFEQISGLDNFIPWDFVEILATESCYKIFCTNNNLPAITTPIIKKIGKQFLAKCPHEERDGKVFLPVWTTFLENRFTINKDGDVYFWCFIDCSDSNIYLSKEFLLTVNLDSIKNILTKSIKRDSCTYIMLDSSTGYYKIGKSINILQRERTLQSEKPTIELVLTINKNVESKLHAIYKSKRVRGEWFALTSDDLVQISIYSNNE